MRSLLIHEKIAISEINFSHNIDYKSILDFKIVWVVSGEANLEIDQMIVKIGSNDFAVIMPEHDVKFEINSETVIQMLSFSVDYLQLEAKAFSIDLFKLFIRNSADKVCKVNNVMHVSQIQEIFAIILNFDITKVIDQQICIHLMNAILLLIIKNNHTFVSVPDKYFTRIHDFFILVFKYSKVEKRVTFYADQLAITPKRLNQILQNYTRRSASYFIQEHNIMQAKHLLRTDKMNITEIAFELGYDDIAYFSRFFKKWTGISPERYRKQY